MRSAPSWPLGGMELVEVLGDVAGAPYDAAADSFAVVAGRP